jgi:hypothetical protein
VNTFATIVTDDRYLYQKVTYYSVHIEGEALWEVDKFFEKMEQKAEEDDILRFVAVLEEIGDTRGAKKRYFRDERGFNALPPKSKGTEDLGLETLEVHDNWRLYCLRLSESIVILFNGGIKTTQKAQDCPNVSRHFYQAQKFTKLIDEALRNGDIQLSGRFLKINSHFELSL